MNFIIYDLEATCWQNRPTAYKQEIIEIGAIYLDGFGTEIGTFKKYIKPILHPYLSSFCTELTGIQQYQVNRSYFFEDVIQDFKHWADVDHYDYRLCSWGSFDEKMLRQDSFLHDIETTWLDNKCINLKSQFQELNRLKQPWGLKKTLNKLGFEFEGEQHNALHDAINLSKIFKAQIDQWYF